MFIGNEARIVRRLKVTLKNTKDLTDRRNGLRLVEPTARRDIVTQPANA